MIKVGINFKFTLFKKMKKKRGFTLIELLVVIAIIGMLAGIVLVSMGTARAKARDARRQSDIRQYGLAMEMYYDSQSPNSYPAGLPDTATAIVATLTLLDPYMRAPLPIDPTNSGNYIYYWTDLATPTTKYCVYARLESISTATWMLSNPNGSKTTITDPGAAADCSVI